jgi:hypothetical protein
MLPSQIRERPAAPHNRKHPNGFLQRRLREPAFGHEDRENQRIRSGHFQSAIDTVASRQRGAADGPAGQERADLLRKCAQMRFTCFRLRRLPVRDEDSLNGSFLPRR